MQQPRNLKAFLIVSVIGLGILNMGPMLKKEDPIRATQTDSIKYEDKLKEMEAGAPKGAPRPSFRYYWKRLFLVEFPFFKGGDKAKKDSEFAEVKEATELWTEDAQTTDKKEENDDWWFEQWDNKGNN